MTRTTDTQPSQTVDEQTSQEVATIQDKELLARFAEMAIMIPAETDGGTEEILAKVLAAKSWAEVDEPWRTTDVDDILRKELRVTKVTRRPSTIGGGLGMFLIVNLRDTRSGKEYVKTTGSIAVVGQFAALYAMGATAITIEWCKAERPTEQGFFPQHIRVVDAHVPGKHGDG